jgi:hypothetical protein
LSANRGHRAGAFAERFVDGDGKPGRRLGQEASRIFMGVQQCLDAPLQGLVPGTGSNDEGQAVGLRLGKSIVEDFFCIHRAPLFP